MIDDKKLLSGWPRPEEKNALSAFRLTVKNNLLGIATMKKSRASRR